ncbi:LOW QUALITY PROTEIN: uncharacterized protein LOC115308876 [Ixodes scapularis]|uniref:LOW QUALITY PROTEIN: uncharacterized protein LOC115308876 n=1 Tax=Ixodes scapularis TaxID=6945 RepID=UPI001C390A03|nr:LOW QUALITY PROTEIN: uncharacterized protein LOC115308876 [Ixodes scapularis]
MSGRPKPPVPPKPVGLQSADGCNPGFRKPVLTVSPLGGAARCADDAGGRGEGDGLCKEEEVVVHEVTVVLEHRGEALCNGANDAMAPATNDPNDATPGTSGPPKENGESGGTLPANQPQPSDDGKRNTIIEDWALKDSGGSGDEACCMRLSHLIHRKAKEFSTHLAKPPKPPKPVKPASRSEEPSRPKSFGDEIPGGKHGIRYADEDTETSSDYQDLDLSRLAVAEVTNATAASAKPAVVENEYEVIEAPRVVLRNEPPAPAPIVLLDRPGSGVVPEATRKKTRSLEKPKRPPPPKPELVKKPLVKIDVPVFPAECHDPEVQVGGQKVAVTETAGTTETVEVSDEPAVQPPKMEEEKETGAVEATPVVEEAVTVTVEEQRSVVPPNVTASPAKKPKPQRPPPPKIPPSVPSKKPEVKSATKQIVASKRDSSKERKPVVSLRSPRASQKPVSEEIVLVGVASVGVVSKDTEEVPLVVSAQVVADSCQVVNPPAVKVASDGGSKKMTSGAGATSPKSVETVVTPKKKRTPPPRPPPPKIGLKPVVTPKRESTEMDRPTRVEEKVPASAEHEESPLCVAQQTSPRNPLNEYCQTDDLVDFRAKKLVENLDAILKTPLEPEEPSHERTVACLEASLDTMAREVVHCFRPPDADLDPEVAVPTAFFAEENVPQAPPRVKRRQRSRTVETVRVPSEDQRRSVRRSHSLSEADVRLKAAQRLGTVYPSDVAATITETFVMVVESPLTKKELRDLYTNIAASPQAKERRFPPKPTPGTGMRFRPLPAPPPPPRGKVRSPPPPIPVKVGAEAAGATEEATEGTADDTVPKEVVDDGKAPPEEPQTATPSTTPAAEEKPDEAPSDAGKRESPCKECPAPTTGVNKSDSFMKRAAKIAADFAPQLTKRSSVEERPSTPASSSNGSRDRDGGLRLSNSTFYATPPALEIPPEAQRGAESPGTEPTASEKSRSSWYDDSDASGDVADVDSPAMPSDADRSSSRKSDSSPGSVQRSKARLKEKKRLSSKFYCEMEKERESSTDGEAVPRVPSRAGAVAAVADDEVERKGEDTDDLLEKAEVLKEEMKQVLVERQKRLLESLDSELSAQRAESESREERAAIGGTSPSLMPRKDMPSVHSSASEVSWQGSSDEESDGEETRHMTLEDAACFRRRRKLFHIAQELASSEQVFVDALHLLNQDFREAVQTASEDKGAPVVPEEVLEQVLKHLPQLQDLNERLLGQLRERIDNWHGNERVADVLVKMGPFLKLYSSYIKDFEAATAALDEAKRKYPDFNRVVRNFEQSPRCRQLTLPQYMLKPIQRIPQYRLLLRDYVDHLDPDSPEYRDACAALDIVAQVAHHANESMKLGDNFSKLMSIQNSLVNRYEVIKPGRNFLKEGELMKVSRKEMQPRWFILLSDSLLYLTPAPQGGLRWNLELPLSGMKVAVPPQQDYQNEFSVITSKRSFILCASSPKEREEWITALNEAIEDNIHRKSSFHVLRKEGSQSSSSSELGHVAPLWIPDQRVTMCQLCTSGFSFTHRRHHCRACGKVVCAACSANKMPLQFKGPEPVRVCDDCFISLRSGEAKERSDPDQEGGQGLVKKKKTVRGILQEVPANDLGSSMSGYLHQYGKRGWKRQWFVVKDHVLYMYRASEDVAALRTTPLLGYQVCSLDRSFEGVPQEQLFELTHVGVDPSVFYADSPDLAARWRKAMEEAATLS